MYTRRSSRFASLAVIAILAVACGSNASSVTPINPSVTPIDPSVAPAITAAPDASVTAPASAAPAAILLEPVAAVNAYYCVTDMFIGKNSDRLRAVTVRDQVAQALTYESVRDGKTGGASIIEIGDRQWENHGQGFKSSDTDDAFEQTARSFDVPSMFTRFFLDTASLSGFESLGEDSRSNMQVIVYRAEAAAKEAMTVDAAIGSVTQSAYYVTPTDNVLVGAYISGQDKSGGPLEVMLSCAQYDDPTLVIKAPTK